MSYFKKRQEQYDESAEACRIVKEALKDEVKGSKMYQRLHGALSGSGKRTVSGIKADENRHHRELLKLSKKLKCSR